MGTFDGSGPQPDVPRRRSRTDARTCELGRSVFLGYSPAPRPVVLALDAAELRAGPTVLARDVHVVLRREDRVRLAGPNGAGKTTLLTRLLEANPARSERVFFLGQEVDRRGRAARSSIACAPSPPTRAGGRCRWSPRSGRDPDRLLASGAPSAGEVRKLLLAEGLARRPWAVVLDEPTNHLDLPTIERLGAALRAYPGALLLVTHDDALAEACTTTRCHRNGNRETRILGRSRPIRSRNLRRRTAQRAPRSPSPVTPTP